MPAPHLTPPDPDRPLLAIDSGSPETSAALGAGGRVLAARVAGGRTSSSALLRLIDELLAETGIGAAELGGVVAAAGPGSFTGLRVGLATVLGLHQALGLPATAVPTLAAIAVAAGRLEGGVTAAVDALRGEWHAQPFAGWPPEPASPPRLVALEDLGGLGPSTVAGFGMAARAGEPGWPRGVAALEPGPLAPALLELVRRRPPRWDPARLVRPIYLRAPAAQPSAGAAR